MKKYAMGGAFSNTMKPLLTSETQIELKNGTWSKVSNKRPTPFVPSGLYSSNKAHLREKNRFMKKWTGRKYLLRNVGSGTGDVSMRKRRGCTTFSHKQTVKRIKVTTFLGLKRQPPTRAAVWTALKQMMRLWPELQSLCGAWCACTHVYGRSTRQICIFEQSRPGRRKEPQSSARRRLVRIVFKSTEGTHVIGFVLPWGVRLSDPLPVSQVAGTVSWVKLWQLLSPILCVMWFNSVLPN